MTYYLKRYAKRNKNRRRTISNFVGEESKKKFLCYVKSKKSKSKEMLLINDFCVYEFV